MAFHKQSLYLFCFQSDMVRMLMEVAENTENMPSIAGDTVVVVQQHKTQSHTSDLPFRPRPVLLRPFPRLLQACDILVLSLQLINCGHVYFQGCSDRRYWATMPHLYFRSTARGTLCKGSAFTHPLTSCLHVPIKSSSA